MLTSVKEVYCGVFDSNILRKNESKSLDRTVGSYEIELFHNDGGVSYVNDKKYPTRRGMLLCARPGQIRHTDFPVRCSFIRVMPDQKRHQKLINILDSLPECTYIEDTEYIEKLLGLFRKLGNYLINSAQNDINDLKINSLFLEILYRCAYMCDDASSAPDKPIERIAREAYEFINEHYRSDCSLKHIADAVNVSPNYLHTVFLNSTGMTPFEYTTKKRIEHAQRLIMAGELTMLDIALETGFCSQSHFNKVFKSQVGLTPVEYRKKLIEQY